MTPLKTWVFGTGHLLNDICAAIWFNYGMVYFASVQKISPFAIGIIILIGQVADAAATPLVGFLADRYNSRLGKRTPWYIFGTAIMPVCFMLLFFPCLICEQASSDSTRVAIEATWFTIFASAENIGWAAIQIAHLSLIPALTPVKERRDTLISIRNAFTFIANILVLLLALALFRMLEDAREQFLMLAGVTVSLGVLTNLLFLFVIKEKPLCQIAEKGYEELANLSLVESAAPQVTWRHWLQKPQLYCVGLLYMVARLGNNFTTSMIPLFLLYVLDVQATGGSTGESTVNMPWELAAISLAMYSTSVVTSFTQDRLHWTSRRLVFLIGCVFLAAGGVPLIVLEAEAKYALIGLACLLGVGFCCCMNAAVGMISAFIGRDASSGAFVWGIMGFLDKLSSGLMIFLVTNLGDLTDSDYIRGMTSSLLLGCAGLGAVGALFVEDFREVSEKEAQFL